MLIPVLDQDKKKDEVAASWSGVVRPYLNVGLPIRPLRHPHRKLEGDQITSLVIFQQPTIYDYYELR